MLHFLLSRRRGQHPPSTTFCQVVVGSDRLSPEPDFLQSKLELLPQLVLMSLVLQTLPQLLCTFLDLLQDLNVLLVVWGLKLKTGFKVQPQQLYRGTM